MERRVGYDGTNGKVKESARGTAGDDDRLQWSEVVGDVDQRSAAGGASWGEGILKSELNW